MVCMRITISLDKKVAVLWMMSYDIMMSYFPCKKRAGEPLSDLLSSHRSPISQPVAASRIPGAGTVPESEFECVIQRAH